MKKDILEVQIINLLRVHAPIKARNLAKMLSEGGEQINRSDVNSVLYELKSANKTTKNDAHEWSIKGAIIKKPVKKAVKKKVAQPYTPPSVPDEILQPVMPSVIFTPEQQSIIDLDPSNHLLIRGQAGSGKTTVLAARAGKIISATSKGSLLFLTYNSALCSYVKSAFNKAGMKGDIDVRTFHEWTRQAVKSLGYDFNGWVNGSLRAEKIVTFIDEAESELGEHRLYDLEKSPHLLDWWGAEIAWMFGQYIQRLDEYRAVERTERGIAVRLTREDRRYVWPVYEQYIEWLDESGKEDYDNPAGLLLRVLEESNQTFPNALRYDHVMVDEVQDFDKSWLLAVAKIPRISLSLAGDLLQRIYHRSFTWTSTGIQVQGGRSRKLGGSHRTTAEIMKVAECLLAGDKLVGSDDAVPILMPSKHGDRVKMLVGSNPKNAYDTGYKFIADHYKRMRTTSVVVALPFSRQLYAAQKALESRGVKVSRAKGSKLGNFDGGVVATTYHQLKGLEFDHVVIMGLHDAQYPARLLELLPEEDREDEAHIMRRVLYMAMTRAKQSVTLVGSNPFCRFFDSVPKEMFEVTQ
jgi:superfamily I DNA/RNA helicase